MPLPLIIILSALAIINIAAFIVMMIDKGRSVNPGASRISEGQIFLLAGLFGSLGVYAGMFAFRHKTKKWYFVIGIPLLILQNAALAYTLYLTVLEQF
ncbi:MAG: DUF1294 domain-containing protein [bacterium]|nr:DUF1294 domain-containing protein [bacterium]